MSSDPERRAATTLAQDCALVPPRPGGWAWVGDAQMAWALLAAVPVWAALGVGVGLQMHVPAGWGGWLSFALIQPVTEELVFRGVLQGQLLRLSAARRVGPVTLANVATTAVFVGLHFVAQPLPWALAVAIPSLLFGHLRERFGSLLPVVTLHAIYNAGFGLTAWWVQR